jgi:hypothetical protein
LSWCNSERRRGHPHEVPFSGTEGHGESDGAGPDRHADLEAEEPWFLAALTEAYERVSAAVMALGESDWTIVTARMAGLSFTEIGSLVGHSASWVHGRWTAILHRLKGTLGG